MPYLIQSFLPGWRIRFLNAVPPIILNSLHGLPVCFQRKRMAALLLFPSPYVLATFRVPQVYSCFPVKFPKYSCFEDMVEN